MSGLIPLRFWPAIALVALWLVALICNMFGGAIDMFGAYCARLALPLTWIIVPFTIVVSIAAALTSQRGEQKTQGRRVRSIVFRLGIALVLTFIALLIWPRPFVSYTFHSVANRVRMAAVPDFALTDLNPDLRAKIPIGETELRHLPEDLFQELYITIDADPGIDGWGNPYMFVAENRENGLWLGIYSKGQDGISASRGNDPDDQNSWGYDASDYYLAKINRQALIQLAMEGGLAFASSHRFASLVSDPSHPKQAPNKSVMPSANNAVGSLRSGEVDPALAYL